MRARDAVTIVGSGLATVSTVVGSSTITIGAPALPTGTFVLGTPGDTTLIGAGYTEVGSTGLEVWKATTTTGAPTGRSRHTAVWTGSKMIVWGGDNGAYLNTGGQWLTFSYYVKN